MYMEARRLLQGTSWKRLLKVADVFTLLNLVFGVYSMIFSIQGNFIGALLLMVFAAIADWLDGRVARMLKQAGELGKQIDSLADVVSFGVAPAILGFMILGSTWQAAASVFLVVCGVLRLARFNIVTFKGYFVGLPIPVVPFAVGIYYISGMDLIYLPILYVLLGIFMVSGLKVKKI